jgi:hypothetical protein
LTRDPTWLLEHRGDVFSQTGEDGIIAEILEALPSRNGWCAEFGAWDGHFLSNTANLVVNNAYSAVLIEADAAKFDRLKANYTNNENVIPLNYLVGFGKQDNLDAILEMTPIPLDFDFLSIDIDGNDYHVWRASQKYAPKVVCIEFNPTIPTDVHFVQKEVMSVKHGNSLAALTALGKEKGYELVCVLPFNAFFVKYEFFHLFEIRDNSPASLRFDTSAVTYFFSGYDGSIFLRGARRLPWHVLNLDEAKFQVFPRWLRQYPPDYSSLQRLFYRIMRKIKSSDL